MREREEPFSSAPLPRFRTYFYWTEPRTAFRAAQRTPMNVRLRKFLSLDFSSTPCFVNVIKIASDVPNSSENPVASFSLTKPLRMRITLRNIIYHILIRRHAHIRDIFCGVYIMFFFLNRNMFSRRKRVIGSHRGWRRTVPLRSSSNMLLFVLIFHRKLNQIFVSYRVVMFFIQTSTI